jgi:hypothetical protein
MSSRRLRYAAVIAASAALPLLHVAKAAAQPPANVKFACIDASEKAQKLRAAGKLVAASQALKSCVLDACPGPVREACSQWMGEVSASLPSIVIGARDAEGKDIVDLKVSIDGAVVSEHLGGRALPIDPGGHAMRYELPDGAVVNEEILVREGEKNRPITVNFPAPAKPTIAAVAGPPAALAEVPAGPRKASTGNTVAGIVFAGVGAAALGTALALDLTTTNKVNADKAPTGCANTSPTGCSASEVSGLKLDYDLAGVSLGVGIALVGVATYVLLAHPFSPRAAASPASAFHIVPSPHGSGFALSF